MLLTGCSTAAQRQAQEIGAATRQTTAEFKACITAIYAKPEYAPLLPHDIDLATGQFTMAQLTDESLILPEQARLFSARHDELNPCRARFLKGLSTVRPDLVPILASEFTKGTDLAVQLVERKATWGEWARQVLAAASGAQQQTADADHQLRAELNASSQAEMAQRQAAGAALMEWSAQQQMINAVNRPRQTVCTGTGYAATCTTY
jgi:hypothetical protein